MKKQKGAIILEIEGEIEGIIYQNDTNSYTVAEFGTEEEIVTIVGYCLLYMKEIL